MHEETETEKQELENFEEVAPETSLWTGSSSAQRKTGRIRGFIQGRKKKVAAIILSMILFGGGTGGFLFIAKTFEPMHMITNVAQAAFSITDSGEQRRSTRLFQRMIQGGNKIGEGRNTRRTGNLVADAMYNSRMRSFNDSMRQNGLEFVFDDPDTNRASGIRNLRTGEVETFDGYWDGRRTDIDARVLDDYIDDSFLRRNLARAVPGYKAMKRFDLRQMARFKSGFTAWHYFTDGTRRGVSSVKDALLGRDTSRNQDTDAKFEQTTQNEDGETTTTTTDSNEIAQEVDSKTQDAIDSVRQDVDSGVSQTDAVKAHAGKLKPSGSSLVLAAAGLGCLSVAYSDYIESGQDEVYIAKMRAGASALSLASEMRAPNGNTDLDQISETMELYHSDTEHYDQSATWKRATGMPVNGTEKDINYTYDSNWESEGGTLGALSGVVSTIGGAASNFPGVGEACRFIGNTLTQWVFSIGEVVAAGIGCIGTAGGGCAAVAVTRAAIIEVITELAATGVFEFLLDLLVFPKWIIDNGPVLNFAELGLAMNMINIEHARSVGNVPLNEATMSSLFASAQYEQKQLEAEKGNHWKYFAYENPDSFISRTAIGLNSFSKDPLNTVATTLKSIPKNIGSIFSGTVRANSSNYYKNELQGFGFTNEQIDSIDPVENEEYVLDHLKYYCNGGTSSTGGSCNEDKLSRAKIMREFLVCGQITYYEVYIAEEFKYDNSRRFLGAVDPSDCKDLAANDETVAAGMWLYDRSLMMNINNLSVDTALATDFNRELLLGLANCMKVDWETKQDSGCFGEIFDEPLHIESTESAVPSSTSTPISVGGVEGTAQELARQLLDKGSPYTDSVSAQLERVANGEEIIERDILWVVNELAEKYEFRLTSLRRYGSGGSRHNTGKAADISGRTGIDGTSFTYDGHIDKVQNFIDDSARLLLSLGSNRCGIGVPNNTYVRETRGSFPDCTVFLDIGSAPHIHLDTRR